MTISNDQAKFIANTYLDNLQETNGVSIQITKIQEESFGWVFFYQSQEYLKTGSLSSMLAGNAPFIIDNKDGKVQVLGTAESADFYIKKYAESRA
jgi:Immunity protein 35